MSNVKSAITDTISISLFNRGLAGKIFEDVKRYGAKVVIKNNAAECVLLSPEEYIHLIDELNDAKMQLLAVNRMNSYDPSSLVAAEDLYNELGISEKEIQAADEVEI